MESRCRIQHGYPLRVIVPGWYGVAAVKWLTEIEVIDHSFTGYFQTEKYVYEWERTAALKESRSGTSGCAL